MLPVRIKIEKEINSLLDKALPNDYQKFKTYKHLVRYYEYKDDFFTFNAKLFEFYSVPKKHRNEIKASRIFKVDLSPADYQILALGFHNSKIHSNDIFIRSTDVKALLVNNFQIPLQIATVEIVFASLLSFTLPSNQKLFTVECEDFLDAWKRVCFKKFGSRFENYINAIYPLISKEVSTLELNLQGLTGEDPGNTVLLTLNQIHWIRETLASLSGSLKPVKSYPVKMIIEHPKFRHFNQHVICYLELLKLPVESHEPHKQILVNSLVALGHDLLCNDRSEKYGT